MATRLRDNSIGKSIYDRIVDYDLVSRKEFFKTLSPEHRELYNKYAAVVRKQKSLNNADNRERANDAAKQGMRKLRETRPKEEQKKQRQPWDIKYETTTRKLSRDVLFL